MAEPFANVPERLQGAEQYAFVGGTFTWQLREMKKTPFLCVLAGPWTGHGGNEEMKCSIIKIIATTQVSHHLSLSRSMKSHCLYSYHVNKYCFILCERQAMRNSILYIRSQAIHAMKSSFNIVPFNGSCLPLTLTFQTIVFAARMAAFFKHAH